MEYRSTLETALQLARDERTEEALSILDQSLATPSLMKTPRQFVLIARNAAVLSEGLGDLNRAADYYGRALGLTPEDASLMLALGQI